MVKKETKQKLEEKKKKLIKKIVKGVSISGVAIDDSINENGWALSRDALPDVAEQLIGKQFTIKDIEGVVGKIITTKTLDNRVNFTAEITTENSGVLVPILSGNVDSVSISGVMIKNKKRR